MRFNFEVNLENLPPDMSIDDLKSRIVFEIGKAVSKWHREELDSQLERLMNGEGDPDRIPVGILNCDFSKSEADES